MSRPVIRAPIPWWEDRVGARARLLLTRGYQEGGVGAFDMVSRTTVSFFGHVYCVMSLLFGLFLVKEIVFYFVEGSFCLVVLHGNGDTSPLYV
jgi:hypothetical protein